jgi:hypothetical protein
VRPRRAVFWISAAALGASLGLACASIIGIEDRLPDDLTADASTGDERPVDEDAPSGPSVCPPMAKCVSVPDGWELESLDPSGRRGCLNGYDAPTDVVVAVDGVGCTCRCTETTGGSCAALGATTTFRDYPAAGCGASTSTYTLDVLDGGCTDAAITTTPYVRVPTAGAGPPTCMADAGPSGFKNGQSCKARGAACDDGGTCAAPLAGDSRLCVTRAGDVACPAGFDKKFPVGTSTGADTRQCGTCTCTAGTTCGSPTLELFTGGACTNTRFDVPATGSCTAADSGVLYGSYRYTGKAPGCQPSVPPLLDGGVTIAGQKTVCCEARN